MSKYINKKGDFTEMTREQFYNWVMDQEVTRDINSIQVHHTWRPNYSNNNSNLDQTINMQRYHMEELGWRQIGQQISTYKDGNIVVGGRDLNTQPAGISGQNRGAICIENVGDFDSGADNMTDEHKETILFVYAVLLIKFNLTPSVKTLPYHSWFSSKTCPGTNFFGGNTKTAARNNFIPLVKNKIKELKNENIEELSGVGTTKAKMLNVRTGPTTGFEIYDTVEKGTKLDVTGRADNGWYQVEYDGGFYYVSNNYVDFEETVQRENEDELYRVQVGAYGNIENAKNMKKQLIEKGLPVYITKY